jgi:hypothetical protein
MSSSPPVVVLTVENPGPINTYVIDRVVQAGLVENIVLVRPTPWRWKLRQVYRIGRRQGLRGIIERRRASRFRAPIERQYAPLRDRVLLADNRSLLDRLPRDVRVIRTGTLASRRTWQDVNALDPFIGLQVGAGWIREPLLSVPRHGFLSLHHGMMPAIRGMDSIFWGYVENRPDWIGITLQIINEGLDTGRIVERSLVSPHPAENPYSVLARATVQGADMVCRAVPAIAANGSDGFRVDKRPGVYRSLLTVGALRILADMMQENRIPCEPLCGAGCVS